MALSSPDQKVPSGPLTPWPAYAKQKGVDPKTLDRWAKQGLIDPPVVINGRKYAAEREQEVRL
jgi:predicted site-specific integrase-resolvase